ncbi:MAG TPA: ABC transporter substrate-binding protein [Candidatus Limnocylindria bacterium]|nr:ABC transporter substrate-binding protein [Candidatus Limnocylindria bacterium]
MFVAAACTSPAPATPPPGTQPPATQPPAATDPSDPGATDAPATDAPATDAPASPDPAPTDGEPAPGGRIILGEWQTPVTLQPFFANIFVTAKAVGPVLTGLISVNNEGEWYPYLASEIPTVTETDEGFTIDITLKPGLMWSDGTPLTLNDFAFTYDWAVQTAVGGTGCLGCGAFAILLPETDLSLPLEEQYALENQYVQSIEVSDDGLSATVTWQRKYAGWLAWLATTILPQHYFESVTPDQAAESMPVSDAVAAIPASGPFVFTSASSQGIDYAPNPNFTAFDGPNLDTLGYRFFGTKDGMITAFLTGDVDFIDNMTQADYNAIVGVSPDIGTAELHSAWQYEHLDINTSRSEVGLDDPNVRRAIHHAINKEDLWNVLFPGSPFEEACTNAPPGTWWRAADVTCPQYDTAEAARLLDEAGWTLNEGGQRVNEAGTVMRLRMCTTSGNPTRLTTLGKVNEYLLAVGIPTDIQTADAGSEYFAGWADTTPQTACSIYRGNFDLALFTYILGGDPGGLYFALYHSSQIPSDQNPNGSNDTRMNHPDMDAALESFTEEVDLDVLLESSKQIQQLYADLAPEIALYYRAEPVGIGRRLGGFLQNPGTAGPMWNVHEWYEIP